jgi:hypothetical protein
MSRTYRLSDFQGLLREHSDTSTSRGPAARTTFNGIAAPEKARQFSVRTEAEPLK